MRSCHSICLLVALSWSVTAAAHAQTPAPSTPPQPETPASAQPPVAGSAAPEPAPSESPAAEQTPPAEPPPPSVPAPSEAAAAAEPSVPSPAEMESLLSQQLASNPPSASEWTAPAPVFTLHGYMRVRGELMDTFWLGRPSLQEYATGRGQTVSGPDAQKQGPDAFTRFRPLEARVAPADGCVDESRTSAGTCDVGTLRFANMRLRLSPELALSEDVRVKMSFDVFDNMIMGEPPVSFYGTSGAGLNTVFASGVRPPSDADNLGDAIKPRRAWAEVRNRNLGELHFGRMPRSWGLGMYYNAGDGLDDDLSTDVDSVMGITKLAGIYLSAAYDFLGEGFFVREDDRPLEQSQLDDVDQFTFSAAIRSTPEELAAAHERGQLVLNGGVQFSIRNQDSYYDANPADPAMMPTVPRGLRTIEATHYTTDAWALLKYRGLRLEAEVAWVSGSMDRIDFDPTTMQLQRGNGSYDINQLGYALQAEYRLVDERLGLHFEHGLATGDSSVEGLSSGAVGSADNTVDFVTQRDGDDTISTFRFHPSYRVDLILWRNIMRQVTGAYYFRPGISYDFVRSAFGQLAGARLDVIYSRAAAALQTWGNDANLGLEIDATMYFRTEDGPDFTDGFNAMLQYGVLFPMDGLNYLQVSPSDPAPGDLHVAQTLRLVLGVVF